jgi:membrane-associated protein
VDQWLIDVVSGSPWTYGLIFAVAALDAVFPFVPSESVVITAGVLAAQGDLRLELIIPVAALGAMCGDNTSYLIGSRLGRPAARKFLRGERGKKALEWGEKTLTEHGGLLIVVARFVPGGRTATTFAAGTLEYPWRRKFLPYDAIAGCLWASYAALVGYFGGKTFEDSPWKALLLAFGIAFAVVIVVELIRRLGIHQWVIRRLGLQGSQ